MERRVQVVARLFDPAFGTGQGPVRDSEVLAVSVAHSDGLVGSSPGLRDVDFGTFALSADAWRRRGKRYRGRRRLRFLGRRRLRGWTCLVPVRADKTRKTTVLHALGEPAGGECLGGGRVGQRGPQGVLEGAGGVLTDPASGRLGQLAGLPDESLDEEALLTGQRTQLRPGCCRRRFSERVAQLRERPDRVGTFARELIGQPGDQVRLGEPVDLPGQIFVAG